MADGPGWGLSIEVGQHACCMPSGEGGGGEWGRDFQTQVFWKEEEAQRIKQKQHILID